VLDRTVLAPTLIAVGLLLGTIVPIGSLGNGFAYGIIAAHSSSQEQLSAFSSHDSPD